MVAIITEAWNRNEPNRNREGMKEGRDTRNNVLVVVVANLAAVRSTGL